MTQYYGIFRGEQYPIPLYDKNGNPLRLTWKEAQAALPALMAEEEADAERWGYWPQKLTIRQW